MFKKIFLTTPPRTADLSLTGCASVLSSSTQLVEPATYLEEASITVRDRSSEAVYKDFASVKEEPRQGTASKRR